MLKYRAILFIILNGFISLAYSQAAYMHEAYEDAVESGSDGASGIISLVVFFGIVWIVSKIYDSYKEDKKRSEEIKHDREISSKVASTTIQKHPDISKYQNRESWQKGFANATFDLSHNKVKSLVGKTVEDLIQEYRHLCEMGHMVQAESIMEQIGYYQKLEFNQKQLDAEKKAKEQTAPKSKILQESKVQVAPVIEHKPFETEEFILSPDKKTLQKGKDVEVIHIPVGVERIQDNAFSSLKHIKEVIIPNGIKEIGSWAFNFSSIEKVVIPPTIEKIGEYAFCFCKNLKEIEIKEGVRRLGIGMFSSCDSLEKIHIPSSISVIPDSCFESCISLVDIKLPQSIIYIGDSAFYGCSSLTTIDIPESVTDIGIEAFRQCYELKSVIIPPKVVGLSEMLFYDDCQLETVVLPNNLTCIMESVFYQCSNLKIKLPPSVSHIEKDAFMSCHDMQMEVPKGKKEWIESVEENVKGHVSEYDYEEEYVLTKEIEERTKYFLDLHEEKNRKRSDAIMESLGFSTRKDDDYYFPDDDFDNDFYDNDY